MLLFSYQLFEFRFVSMNILSVDDSRVVFVS